jgi:uncharacterized protein
MFSLVIIILLFFGIDFYVWQAVKTAFLSPNQDSARWTIFTFYWGINVLLPLIIFLAAFEMRKGNPMSSFSVWIGNIWFALLITKLIVLLILFGEDLFRILFGSYQKFVQASIHEENNFLPDRRKLLSQLALGIAVVYIWNG